MRREPKRTLLQLLLGALLLGRPDGLLGATPPPAEAAQDLFSGFLAAANATEIYAPETNFRVRGWNSSWSQVNLLELAPEGKEVKAGDVLARFEFIGRDALEWISNRIHKAEADGTQAKLVTRQVLDTLVMEARRRALEAEQAGLDVQREKAISRRQAELFRIRKKIADFEVEAADQRIGATRKATEAEIAYQDLLVESVRSDMDHYKFYERRFDVVAPHAGIVRHVFNSKAGRMTQKGDGISGGQRILSLAKDAVVVARFFVPEHRLSEIKVGTEVLVTTTASAKEHRATVSKIDFFPQELSFLTENPDLPNGQEKAFAVTAEFQGGAGDASAGLEIRVKARAR